MTEITILSVTRLSSGVCVAGVANDGEWVRPTRPNASDTWRQLEYVDCEDRKGNWIVQKGNRVKMDLVEPIPKGAHSEDWRIGDRKAQLVHELSDDEYLNFCENHQEKSLEPLLPTTATRSLILVRPERFTSFTFYIDTSWEGKRSYIPRCGFVVDGQQYLRKPISDAEWRKYGRKYLRKNPRPKVRDILDENCTENYWLTIGRNIMGSTLFLMVVGIHLFPVRHFAMDFKRS